MRGTAQVRLWRVLTTTKLLAHPVLTLFTWELSYIYSHFIAQEAEAGMGEGPPGRCPSGCRAGSQGSL